MMNFGSFGPRASRSPPPRSWCCRRSPPRPAGLEIEVRVAPQDVAVSFAVFRPAPADDDAAAVTLERASPIYGVFDRAPRQFPFYGTALALVAVGTDETVPAVLVADADGVRVA